MFRFVLQGLFYGVKWVMENQEKRLKQVGLTPGLKDKTFIVQVSPPADAPPLFKRSSSRVEISTVYPHLSNSGGI